MNFKEEAELFSRNISITSGWDSESIVVSGRLRDTYHEVEAEVRFSFPGLEIIEAKGKLNKYPHNECIDSTIFLKNLKGLRVSKSFYAKLMEKVGGKFGCVHMNNLLYEMGMAAIQARFACFDRLAPPDFNRQPKPKKIKLYLEWMPGIRNACTAWADDGPMVKSAEEEKGD